MRRGEVTELIKMNGFRDADPKGQKTVPTKLSPIKIPPVLRLDYVFYKNIKVNNFEVLKGKEFDYLSDHYPILAEIE